MKKILSFLSMAVLLAFPVMSLGEPTASAPLYKVTVVQSSAVAINYRYLKSSTMIGFKGTVLLPGAKGEAEVESEAGATAIDARFENLPPAPQFGPEYLTYVLWAISPEGRAINLGQVIVKDGRSELEVTSQLQAFGLIVTAEPYFAVSQPGNVVVLENEVRPDTEGKIETINAKYELLQRGQYAVNIVPSDLPPAELDPKVPPELYQAQNALHISKAAGADIYAPDSYLKAEQFLDEAEGYQRQRHWYSTKRKEVAEAARQAIQVAEDARLIAIKRHETEDMETQRQLTQDQITVAQEQAEKASKEKAAADAALAEAKKATAQAEAAKATALEQASKAESDKAALRAQLLAQLNLVLQTRDTVRGLIVNMSGVLFEFGKYDLVPAAREKLAKIAGILLVHPRLNITIEGHTDSVGSDEYNQTLSEKRAQAARDYLISQGIAADSIVARGLGKADPVASNDTPDGRAQNRRVEIIVSGEEISEATSAQNPRP